MLSFFCNGYGKCHDSVDVLCKFKITSQTQFYFYFLTFILFASIWFLKEPRYHCWWRIIVELESSQQFDLLLRWCIRRITVLTIQYSSQLLLDTLGREEGLTFMTITCKTFRNACQSSLALARHTIFVCYYKRIQEKLSSFMCNMLLTFCVRACIKICKCCGIPSDNSTTHESIEIDAHMQISNIMLIDQSCASPSPPQKRMLHQNTTNSSISVFFMFFCWKNFKWQYQLTHWKNLRLMEPIKILCKIFNKIIIQ